MEETVTVFDWNLVWAIPLGIIIGAGIMWFWLKRGKMPSIKSKKEPKQPKKHKKDDIPDSDWPNASWEDEVDPKKLATVTPSNHESQLG